MEIEDLKNIYAYYDSVHYEQNKFTAWYSNDLNIMGGLCVDQPEKQKFFAYATIYNTVMDVDKKVKFSAHEAAKYGDVSALKDWRPLEEPSENEWKAGYYIENAIYRVGTLWDLLAQLFNIQQNYGKPFDKVYAEQLFHDAQQGKHPNAFAKKVYDYISQKNDDSGELFKGTHCYIKGFRDKLTHRYSPNVSSISNYAAELRQPSLYVLYRLTEDYLQVSIFLDEIFSDILKEYDDLSYPEIEGE